MLWMKCSLAFLYICIYNMAFLQRGILLRSPHSWPWKDAGIVNGWVHHLRDARDDLPVSVSRFWSLGTVWNEYRPFAQPWRLKCFVDLGDHELFFLSAQGCLTRPGSAFLFDGSEACDPGMFAFTSFRSYAFRMPPQALCQRLAFALTSKWGFKPEDVRNEADFCSLSFFFFFFPPEMSEMMCSSAVVMI